MKINLFIGSPSSRTRSLSMPGECARGGKNRWGVIFLVMIYMLAWGQRHFLPMDQRAREKAVKRFFPSRRRMVCSDSTMARSLAGFDVTSVRPCVGPHLPTTADSTDAGPGGTAAAPPRGHRCNIAGPL